MTPVSGSIGVPVSGHWMDRGLDKIVARIDPGTHRYSSGLTARSRDLEAVDATAKVVDSRPERLAS